MSQQMKAMQFSMLAAFLIGIYVGIFTGEATVIYQCEQNGTTTISGAFWKGEIKYACQKSSNKEAQP
jgi:hypothetical protein